MEIKAKVKEFIVDNFLMDSDSQEFNDTTSFLEQGIIDSTGILELVEFLQDTFEIKIDDEELMPENLDSLNNIENFVNLKKNNS